MVVMIMIILILYINIATTISIILSVIEIWRHKSVDDMMISRESGRNAIEWRKSIKELALLATSFNTSINQPTIWSPWR